MKTCAVEDCVRGMWANRMCRLHDRRLREYGRLELLPVRSPAERLAAKLERKPNGCLEWTGATNRTENGDGGYGHLSVDGKHVLTHRLAWELVHGPIPEGMVVCHTCDRPPCCDVTHMFLGTHVDNMADMLTKGRGRWRNK